MKTLGQIACEGAGAEWDYAHGAMTNKLWEAAAQAVRSAVIDECVKACEYGPYPMAGENSGRYHLQAEWADRIQSKLKHLKHGFN